MRPTILPGRSVRVTFCAGPIRLGDLVVFRQADYLAVHRFLGRTRDPAGVSRLRTRGDGAQKLDPAVEPARIVGRVLALERPDGWWSVDGAVARSYAIAIALHDLFWAVVGSWAARLDRALGTGWGRRVGRMDRGLLSFADTVGFRALHARVAPPPADILGPE